MFHTVLMETGNWSDAGHPTGRRVTFTNSFAIEGHYFNFSTSGRAGLAIDIGSSPAARVRYNVRCSTPA